MESNDINIHLKKLEKKTANQTQRKQKEENYKKQKINEQKTKLQWRKSTKPKIVSSKRLIKLISAKQDPMGIEKITVEYYKQLNATAIWQFKWIRKTHLTKTDIRRNKTSVYFYIY